MRISDWSSDVCAADQYAKPGQADAEAGEFPAGQPFMQHQRAHRQQQQRHGEGEDRRAAGRQHAQPIERSEEHTSELQSLMRNSYAVICLKKQKPTQLYYSTDYHNNYTNYS